MTSDPVLRQEFEATLKCSMYIGAIASTPRAGKKLAELLKTGANRIASSKIVLGAVASVQRTEAAKRFAGMFGGSGSAASKTAGTSGRTAWEEFLGTDLRTTANDSVRGREIGQTGLGANKDASIPEGFGKESLRTSVRAEWLARKAKIHGKAQKTGTPGHEIGSMKVAIRESKKPEVTRVHMDTSLQKVTGGQTKSRMRPDVTVVREDGRITTHEVMSKSQDKKQLQGKIARMRDTLPEGMRSSEGGDVFDVTGKKL